AGLAALALFVAACEPASTSAPSAGANSVAAAAPSGTSVPELVGLQLDKAKTAAKQAGFKSVESTDVAGGDHKRTQIVEANWKVCQQTPASGTAAPVTTKVTLGVVKDAEPCPGAAAPTTAAPSSTTPPAAAPAPSAPPVPTPTKAAPAPTAAPSSEPAAAAAPAPGGTCAHHTVGLCGWDHGQTPTVPDQMAVCKDGTPSTSKTPSGTCSKHDGVQYWFK
ncbi:PASTA domain-containing protein, partial [Kitasatospora purpeofusca]|uniref:PASTA domain-containing protein n=1 Tax=Kitasatospora purpeofusca TaxID=67352 RepID=UPI0035E2AE9A